MAEPGTITDPPNLDGTSPVEPPAPEVPDKQGRVGAAKGGRPRGKARDRKPRAKRSGGPSTAAKAKPKPTTAAIQETLTELLTAPGMAFAISGQDWPRDHVFRTGPELAENLAKASEHNVWLRARLEALASGDAAFGQVLLMAHVMVGLVVYAVPLAAYFVPGVPDSLAAQVGAEPIVRPGRVYAPADEPESSAPADASQNGAPSAIATPY